MGSRFPSLGVLLNVALWVVAEGGQERAAILSERPITRRTGVALLRRSAPPEGRRLAAVRSSGKLAMAPRLGVTLSRQPQRMIEAFAGLNMAKGM